HRRAAPRSAFGDAPRELDPLRTPHLGAAETEDELPRVRTRRACSLREWHGLGVPDMPASDAGSGTARDPRCRALASDLLRGRNGAACAPACEDGGLSGVDAAPACAGNDHREEQAAGAAGLS